MYGVDICSVTTKGSILCVGWRLYSTVGTVTRLWGLPGVFYKFSARSKQARHATLQQTLLTHNNNITAITAITATNAYDNAVRAILQRCCEKNKTRCFSRPSWMGGIFPLSTRAAIAVQFTFNEAAPGFFVAGGGNSAFCFKEKKRSK